MIAGRRFYVDSGVMIFIVNHVGLMYQNNLGKDALKRASTTSSYNSDEIWKEVRRHVVEADWRLWLKAAKDGEVLKPAAVIAIK
jgi:hypothetical protein